MKPNILLITADQMRWDCLGCTGNPVIRTPFLDSLARKGIMFTNAFSPNPICVPARATIMTGNYPAVCTGERTNSGSIKPHQPLLTEILKKAGYETYATGKLHFLPYSPPDKPRLVHGFQHVDLHESGRILACYDPEGKKRGLEDYFDYLAETGWSGYSRAHGAGNNDVRPCPSPLPAEHYVDAWVARCAMRRIEEHQKQFPDRPFFLWMSSPKPHPPYDPPRPYDSLYDPRSLPPPSGSPELLKDRYILIDAIRYTHALTSLSPQAWQVIRSYYYGCISFLDAMVGRLLKYLEKSGILKDTFILFTADHGDLLGDFGSAFKANHLNGSVRIPFLVCGPGVPEGRISPALVGLQDILPTLAALAESNIGQKVHGSNLWPVFQNPEIKLREVFYSSTASRFGFSAMVTDGIWKYIYSEPNGTEELYHQPEDIKEVDNLAGKAKFAAQLKYWREKLKEYAREFSDDDIFDGNQLRKKEISREEIRRLPVSGMGWRWY